MNREIFLMSPPRIDWHLRGRANFRSREAGAVDPRAARRQWLALARSIEARGGTVVVAQSPYPELTGMPYAAECGQIVGDAERGWSFILPLMWAPHRRKEREVWEALARDMNLAVKAPDGGLWEAQGDVARFQGVTLLFFGGRTTRAGLDAVRDHFHGEVLLIETREPAFHGNMAVLPLDAVDTLVVCPEVLVGDSLVRLASRFGRDALLEVSESQIREYVTNGLPMGRDLLAPTVTSTEALAPLAARGVEVVRVDLSELCDKAGGASRCLVSRATIDLARHPVPEYATLSVVSAQIDGEG
jgi:N-dimethylarginine dimethylaminohydrolase